MRQISVMRDKIHRKIKWLQNKLPEPPRRKFDREAVDYEKLRAGMTESQLREQDERIAIAKGRFIDDVWISEDIDIDAGFRFENTINSEVFHDCLLAADQLVADPSRHVFLPRSMPLSINLSPYLEEHIHFFRYALSDELVGRVSRYLGQIPVLTACLVMYTPKDQKPVGGSQYFHLDNEDTKIVKVFTSITEQTEQSGPLTFIRRDQSKNIFEKIVEGSPYDGVNYYRASRIDDHIINENCALQEPVKFIAKRGNALFVDTAGCYHYGSRNFSKKNAQDRWLLSCRYEKSHSPRNLRNSSKSDAIKAVPDWISEHCEPEDQRMIELLLQHYRSQESTST